MTTLALDNSTWDLTVGLDGDFLAHTDEVRQSAQDVATSVRVWNGEYIYDRSRGMPYLESIMGKPFYPALFAHYATIEAVRIPTVASIAVNFESFSAEDRKLVLDIVIATKTGETANVTI